MTKKDYELFANEINGMKGLLEQEELDILVSVTSRAFQKDNASFNPFKYAEACNDGKHIRQSIKA